MAQSIAQKEVKESADSSDIITRAEKLGAELDQCWESGTTTITYEDGSRVEVDSSDYAVI